MKKIKKKLVLLITVLLLVSISSLVQGEEVDPVQVLKFLDQVMGSENKVMSQNMTLISASGQERTREIKMWNKRGDQGDQMLARFISPADVRGTGILMNQNDMWLYLPALQKVRRVASHAKKGSFMGSDLSFDDMEQIGSRGFSEFYEPTFLAREQIEGKELIVLKLVPFSTESDYAFLKAWIYADLFLPSKIEYYDLDDALLKTLTTGELTQIEGRWTAKEMMIEDCQKGTKTLIQILEVSFSEEVPDSIFTTRNLERGM